MISLIHEVIAVIRNGTDDPRFHQAIVDAAFLLEKSRGLSPAGWPDEIIVATVTERDITMLKSALVDLVQRGGSACWALGKSRDPAFKPVYIEALRRELNGDPAELYQAMVALDDLGEPVFGDRGSVGVLEVFENREAAAKYLESQERPQ